MFPIERPGRSELFLPQRLQYESVHGIAYPGALDVRNSALDRLLKGPIMAAGDDRRDIFIGLIAPCRRRQREHQKNSGWPRAARYEPHLVSLHRQGSLLFTSRVSRENA